MIFMTDPPRTELTNSLLRGRPISLGQHVKSSKGWHTVIKWGKRRVCATSFSGHGDTINRGFATSRELPSLINVTSTIYSCFDLPSNWPIYLRSPYTLEPKSGLVPLKEPLATGRLSSSTFQSPSSTASDLHLSSGATTPNPILHLSTTAGRSHCTCMEIK